MEKRDLIIVILSILLLISILFSFYIFFKEQKLESQIQNIADKAIEGFNISRNEFDKIDTRLTNLEDNIINSNNNTNS
ncbi:MAG TPA: hypothetical protein VJI68_00220 [Candidatus Nanoarchaeia archaeon]|nr:hypothetical protein [Candidatus Nanoarchaeia archaeon]